MISAVIITYNEERNIERCLKSIVDIVDEIIIVDSGSTDRTKEICSRYPVKFFEHKWEGYAKQKNFANTLTSFDYIFSIDADEAVSPELKKSILEVKHNLNGAYSFNRLTNYAGHWVRFCGWYPDKKIRIFNKHEACWVGDFIHEELHFKKPVKIHHLKGNLLHYSYYSINDHKERIERYSTLQAQKLFNEKRKVYNFQIYFYALAKFFNDYFIKLGFLDGYTGINICFYSAKAVYLKYKKLKKLDIGDKKNV